MDGIDLTVLPGDIYGCLGPNGAGKTTTLRMLLGLIQRDAGTVRLFGRDPADGHSSLDGVAGFVESPTFYPYLSGRENLELLGALDGGVERRWVDECLDRVELLDRARDRVGGYSLGMRQRLGIAASLMRRPSLLVLDEPANGLDPAGEPFGLRPRSYSVLAVLRTHGAPDFVLPARFLLQATYLTTGGLTNLIDRMEKSGLVERVPNPTDRRSILVKITEHGRDVIDRAAVVVTDLERALASQLPKEDSATFAELVRRSMGHIDRYVVAPPVGLPEHRSTT